MRRIARQIIGLVAVAFAILACTSTNPVGAVDAAYDVLVFSKTAGFRHDSIPAGINAIQQLGAANNFTVTATEDSAAFTAANLAQYEAVVFLNTTGDVLNATQEAAFESYIGNGGGYVGVHSAADTEYGWSFYGNLVGAYFASHPAIQQATIRVENRAHPATAHLGQSWTRTDEWYNYQTNARSSARILATLDESSYSGGSMGADHPTAWCKEYGGGRSFYTGSGHTQATYSEAAFLAHLLGGIQYAAGRAKADCRPETGDTTTLAESYPSARVVQPFSKDGANGGQTLGFIDPGDWASYADVDLTGVTAFKARVVSGGPGGTVTIRTGSPTGTALGSVYAPNTVAMFPPVPESMVEAGYADFAARWNPILDVFDEVGVRFALEAGP